MALFGRTAIDDPELAAIVGRRRVLASGRSAEGQVLGLVDRLVFRGGGQWRQVPWHEIERGAWDEQTRRLRWVEVSGAPTELELIDTGRLTDLFNERVTDSIACTQVVDLATNGTAVITARRDLGDPDRPLIWRVIPGKGVSAEEVGSDPLVALELARLRAEYDLG